MLYDSYTYKNNIIILPLPLSLEELELDELPELDEFEELRLEPLDEPLEELDPDLELDEEPLIF